jgi:Flp pilus assembly CpaF family ATPase
MRSWFELVGGRDLDEGLVAEVHDEAGRRITREMARRATVDGTGLTFADERALGRHLIGEVLAERRAAAYNAGDQPLDPEVEDALARVVHDRIYGLGPLQPVVEHPEVSDVHADGADGVWVHLRDGTKLRGPAAASSDAEFMALISRQARRVGRSERRWDRDEVALNLQLPDGSRLHALREVTGRPVVDIRCHDFSISRVAQLVDCDEVDRAIGDFLGALARGRFNVIVSGGRAVGKTTLLRCLINEIPPEERIITIEDSLELAIDRFPDLHPDCVSIEARDANTEGKGEFTLADGVRESLRMKSDRVIVGEVRGDEVIPMLLAMSQGKDGSMCSVHARSSRDAFDRLQMYAAMTRESLSPEVTAKMVANAVHFVVHLEWDRSSPPRRRVASILEVSHAEGAQVVHNEVWKPDFLGRGVPHARLRQETGRRLAEVGFDLDLLDKPEGWWRR